MLKLTILVSLCALVLAACEGGKPAADDLTVTYKRSGGFMPVDDTMVIAGDGSVSMSDGSKPARTIRVVPTELAKLRTLLSSPEFKATAAEYRNDRGADLITHTIESKVGNETKKVLVMDSSEHPAVLDQVIEELERLGRAAK
jgi:hypothetical protein